MKITNLISKYLFIILSTIAMLTNVAAAQTVSVDENTPGLIGRGTFFYDVPADAVLIGEGIQTIAIDCNEEDEIALAASGLYTLKVHNQEFYSPTTGLGYTLDVSCNNAKCQISVIDGEATVRSYDDYEYGTYDIYSKSYLPTYRISASGTTGLTFYSGTSDLYIAYDFYVYILNGAALNGGHYDISSSKLTIP